MQVETVRTEELGDRSYVAHDGRTAVAIDPQRDLDRVERLLADRDLTLAAVLETHVHNDYVTGGYALARRTGADYVLNAADELQFDRTAVGDGDILEAGALRIRVLATPGHTATHLAYLLTGDDPTEPAALFTGGSLLYGSVGRTDLVARARTDELTRAQFHSVRRLAEQVPDETRVYPTHGFGSFCSSGSAPGGEGSTIGAERSRNPALLSADEQRFVDDLIAGLTAYPAYYAHMAPLNARGPGAADLDAPPAAVDAAELARRLAAGEWVVDLRDRAAYAADHLAGTVCVELAESFATYVGWLWPWGAALTLLGADPAQVAAARRQLARIGVDDLAAAAGQPDDFAAHIARRRYPRSDFAAARRDIPSQDVLLDVRREDEYREGHIHRARNLPIHDLPGRADEVPPGRVWVHCATGYRAGIAASLLDRAGREVVLIDDRYDEDEPARWRCR
jgi:glyoxylase-like metal-dependent hydrolase (beta-lactamase superfamily II)/rhodanese-related sulfurtransferase